MLSEAEVMKLWRQVGLPEYFLGNGGTNVHLMTFVAAIEQATAKRCAEICEQQGHEEDRPSDYAYLIRSAFESKGCSSTSP